MSRGAQEVSGSIRPRADHSARSTDRSDRLATLSFTLSSPSTPVSGAAMQMYKMRWSPDDSRSPSGLAPHEQNEDSALTWEALTKEIGKIA